MFEWYTNYHTCFPTLSFEYSWLDTRCDVLQQIFTFEIIPAVESDERLNEKRRRDVESNSSQTGPVEISGLKVELCVTQDSCKPVVIQPNVDVADVTTGD